MPGVRRNPGRWATRRGLYCVALGRAVFGESMFAHETDASKIARPPWSAGAAVMASP